MDLQLIDNELCESRLYRYSGNFNNLDGKDIAKLLYLTTLTTYMLTLDDETQDYGLTYAKKTSQYGSYSLFRTHATDLYLLAFEVSNPKNKNVSLDNNSSSRDYLNKLNFQPRMHYKFVMDLGHNAATQSEAYSTFYRLEVQLKVNEASYKRWRRLILDWRNLKNIQKQLVVAQITQEFRRIGRGSELLIPLTSMLKDRNYVNSAPVPEPTPSVDAALSPGIAAMAAYWASRSTQLK